MADLWLVFQIAFPQKESAFWTSYSARLRHTSSSRSLARSAAATHAVTSHGQVAGRLGRPAILLQAAQLRDSSAVSVRNMNRLGFYVLVALACNRAVLCLDTETLTIVEGSDLVLDEGAQNIHLTCDLNRELTSLFTANEKIIWAHKSLATPDTPVVVLTEQGTLKDTAAPSEYGINIDFTSVPGHILSKLTLKAVKQAQDGKFICQVFTQKSTVRIQQEIEIVVRNNVESVELTFDGEPPVTTVEPSAVNREEGRYHVSCSAGGFSPEAKLSIFVGQKLVSGENMVKLDADASVAANARRYTVMVGADLDLTVVDSGKSLRCVGKAAFDTALPRTASIPLQIIALEPTIECDKNISHAIGDRYVKITCFVDHTRVEIDRYVFEIGETGEFIHPGNLTSEYHEVLVQPLNDTMTQVQLDLYELDEKHVDDLGGASYFYLDVHLKNGGKFREKAALYVRPSSSASKTAAAFFVILASLVLSL